MNPETARLLAVAGTGLGTGIIWRWLDPESWKHIGIILAYIWVIIPMHFAYILINVLLMDWFGKRTKSGGVEEYIKPLDRRLDNIEAAINRLHDYVQQIDPELEEERGLEDEFMSGQGGIFAGMNHMEYVRDQKKAGKRTMGRSIWRDPTPSPNEDDG